MTRKDPVTGIVNPYFSLSINMAELHDFSIDISQLKFVQQELGVEVYPTPKYHAKIVGEGIEYIWALAKGRYCSKPLKLKKGKAQFKNLVNKVTSREILNTQQIRKVSDRYQAYIQAYYFLDRTD